MVVPWRYHGGTMMVPCKLLLGVSGWYMDGELLARSYHVTGQSQVMGRPWHVIHQETAGSWDPSIYPDSGLYLGCIWVVPRFLPDSCKAYNWHLLFLSHLNLQLIYKPAGHWKTCATWFENSDWRCNKRHPIYLDCDMFYQIFSFPSCYADGK